MIILKVEDFEDPSIDVQFPSNICEFLSVESENLVPLTLKHSENKEVPNYVEMILEEDIRVGSFFTGSSDEDHVGDVHQVILVFLSEDDTLPDDFEGKLRRMAHELLPLKDALNFDDVFGKYFDMLKTGELLSYWKSEKEDDSRDLSEEEQEEIAQEQEEIQEIIEQIEETTQIYTSAPDPNAEMEDLKERNMSLEELLEEKTIKIRELTTKYTELSFDMTTTTEELEALKKELGEQYLKLEDYNEKTEKIKEINQTLTEEINELKDDLLVKEKEIELLHKKLSEAEAKLKNGESSAQQLEDLKSINLGLNSEIVTLEQERDRLNTHLKNAKNENNIHLDTITALKIEIKDIKTELDAKENKFGDTKEQIFDLKKEIKILRRERDHYQKVVKEKNLL